VRGLNNKENELEEKVNKMNAYVAFTSETKTKLKGTTDCFIVFYHTIACPKIGGRQLV
jgi:hypothetical protein